MSYRQKHINPKIKNLRKRKKVFFRPSFWIFLCIILVTAIIGYVVLLLPTFQISHIEVSGNDLPAQAGKIQSNDVKTVVLNDIHKTIFNKNIFTINTESIMKDVTDAFANIETIKISRNFPNGISLEIKERSAIGIFCSKNNSNQCFFIDGNGVIFESLQTLPKDMIIIKNDTGGSNFSLGENVVAKNSIDDILAIQRNLKNNFQVEVSEALISDTLIITTNEHWQIYFDINSDINYQITKMNSLLQNAISATKRKSLQYIYLQFKDKAYYK